MIEQDLYEHLKLEVPFVDGRIFANMLHQDTPKPALVYAVVEEEELACMEGDAGDISIKWEILIYSKEYLKNKVIKDEVKIALRKFGHDIGTITVEDKFDESEELFVQLINFTTRD